MQMFDKNILSLPKAKPIMAALILLALIDSGLIIGQTLYLASALTGLWKQELLASVVFQLVAFGIFWTVRQLVVWIKTCIIKRYSHHISTKIRGDLLKQLGKAGPISVRLYGSGVVTTAAIEGIDQVRAYISLAIPKIADLITIPVVIACVLLYLDIISGVIAVVTLPCIVVYMKVLGLRAKEEAKKQHGDYERLSNHFADAMRGMSTLIAFGQGQKYSKRIFEVSERFRKATVKTLKEATLSSLVLDLFRTFALAAVAIMLGFRLMDGSIELFYALSTLMLIPEFFAPVRKWANDFHASLDGGNQLKAILGIIDECAAYGSDSDEEIKQYGKDSTFELVDLTYSYDKKQASLAQNSTAQPSSTHPTPTHSPAIHSLPTQASTAHKALESINLKVEGFSKVGIVGASGSGKSTLAQLIAGFASPNSGYFKFDEKYCKNLCTDSWKKQCTYIPQDPHIFHATLKENLTLYNPSATDEEISEAINILSLDELVLELPNGLDTIIGEGGRGISGGQAQRIALARAFLDPKRRVLIFDEPTAHLDIETEETLKNQMLPLFEDRLVFFATHRLHWMKNMDILLVLDGGQVAGCGTFDELMASKGPFYRLVNSLRGGEGL